jgi:hypothetical protein
MSAQWPSFFRKSTRIIAACIAFSLAAYCILRCILWMKTWVTFAQQSDLAATEVISLIPLGLWGWLAIWCLGALASGAVGVHLMFRSKS